MQKPMFSDDDERRPLLSEEDLRDACLHAAATIVVAFALECEFKCCYLTDDGYPWPTTLSRVWIKYPEDWSGKESFPFVAMIHEAGSLAVAKQHKRPPHRIYVYEDDRVTGARAANFLDDPLNWELVEAVAQLIRNNYEGDGCYGAEGTDPHWSLSFPWREDLPKLNENSYANRLINNLLATRFQRPAP
jgi:hypothetical protein